MEQSNDNGIRERVARLEENHKSICEDLNFIKSQVSNHIPTSITEMDRRINDRIDTMKTWLIGLLGGIIASLILLTINLLF